MAEPKPRMDSQSRMVKGFVFEGLFIRSLPQSMELTTALKACGFDADNIKAEYSGLVFGACLDAARRLLHPKESIARGYQLLGMAQSHGVTETFLGKVIAPAIRLMSIQRLAGRIPSLFKMDSTPAVVTCTNLSENSVQISFRGDPSLVPEYVSGVIQGLFIEARHKVEVTAKPLAVGDFDVVVKWDPGALK